MVTCPANSNKCESTLRFTKESRENVHACYWFSRDPGYWKSYENLRLKVMQPGELTVESLEGFSNRGQVANQPKVFHISGNGATYGDKVYLVQSASACLEENALDGRVFQTTVMHGATGFAIVVNMTYATAAEDLKMCYQFSTLTASGDKVEGVFHVYGVSGFDAERTVGSIDSVVAGKTKELFLLGAGFAESDMVAWAESGASCAERSQEGAMHKLVDAEAFYAVVSMNTLSAGKEFHLCYKFTNEAWNEYPALALRVKHFAGVNGVSQGNANAFVVSQAKDFYLDDESGASGYSTQDKVHLVLSGQDCADASAYVYTADVEARGEAGHFQFTLDLPEALAGSVYRVCYAFGAEMPVQTSSTVAVKSMPGFVGVLEGTAVDAEQSVNAVVLNKEKKLVFPANKAISDNDRFLLVKSQSECAAATAFQPINSEGAQLYFSVLRSAAEEVNTELFGCIKFNGEPALFLPQVAIRVKSFAGLTATAGDSAVLVLTQPKTFVVSAEGGASVGDSVIIASTSCEDESAANRLVFPVVASGESLQTTVTVGVEGIEPSTPRAWFLCYRFVHEKPAVTSILMEVDGFTSAEALTVSVGDKLKAVVKKEKQYAFATAQGAQAGDCVALGCSCESLLTPMEELSASATATLVLATKPDCAVGVCYKFREEPEVFYEWAMTAYELSSLNGQSAFTKDVVSGERYVFSFEGCSSTEDEFKLVAADADCAATLHDYSDSFGAVLPDIAVEGAMDSEDGSYTILRLGGSGDLTAYFPSMQASMVDGKWTGLNAILVDGVYAYIQKYEPSARFLHLTEKIAVEAGATLKLVHATEMETVASLNAYRANVTLPLTTTSEGLLKLCYAFAGDAFFAYDEYQFRVRQVSPSTLSVSGTPGHTLLKAMKNVVALEGLNLESGDKLLLVQPTERCSAVLAAKVTMTVEDGVASAVVDASLEGSYRLCYKFGEIGIQNTAAVVDVVGASVTGQTSEYNAWFSVANQAHAITYTTPKSEAFEQERVPYFATMANSGYHVTGVLDSLMKPEGELILYATSAANAVFTFSTAHAADVLSRVEQFVVTIENHQLSAVTLEVTLKTGASSATKTVTELVDGVNRVVFDASVAGWSALTFSAPVSYTIKVTSSSISIFNFQRTYSTLVFAVEGAESLKYVREACSEEPVASAVMPVGEDRTVRWLFTEGSATEQWKLCYAIGASGFVGAGVEFNMRVGEVTELVPLVGAANRVVVGIPKTFAVEGSWIQEDDEVFLKNAEAQTPAVKVDANSTFTLDFAEAYSAEPMKVNYRFNSMPVMEYAMTIQQSYVQSTTLSGETNYAVYGIPITVESVGNGFSEADRLYFVEYQNDCAVDGGFTQAFQLQAVSSSAVTAVVTLNELAAGKEVKLCYAFGDEGAIAISSMIHVIRLDDIVVVGGGSKNVAVAGQVKDVTVSGLYLRMGDRITFHATADCASAPVASFPVREIDGVFETSYYFTEGSNGAAYTMCYHYGSYAANVRMYPEFSVVVKKFTGFLDSLVDNEISYFVARNPKPVRVVTDGFAAGDKLAFTASTCSELLTLSVAGAPATSVELSATLVSVDIFDEVASGEVKVCYKFGEEPFALVETPYILYSLTVSEAAGYSVDSIVAGEPKTFLVNRAHPNRDDRFYFVPQDATSCDESERVTDPFFPGEKVEVEIMATIPSNNTYYQLCYVFAGEETQLLGANGPYSPPKWQLMVKGVTEFASGVAVAAMEKEVPVTIFGVAEEDDVFFASGEGCEARLDAVVELSSSALRVLFDRGAPLTTYHLCYTFLGNAVKSYPAFTLSVVELQSVTSAAGEGNTAIWLRPKSLTFNGVGVAEGDRVKYVPFGAGCETAVEFMKDAVTHETVPYYELDAERAITAYFSQESTEAEPYELCYQFGEESWMNYGPSGVYGANSTFTMVVFGRPEVTALAGDKDVFVKDVPKTLVFAGVLITANDRVKVSVNSAVVLDEDEKALHDLWEATSFELDKLQSNPACAEQEQEGLKKRHKPAWKLTYEPRATPVEWLAGEVPRGDHPRGGLEGECDSESGGLRDVGRAHARPAERAHHAGGLPTEGVGEQVQLRGRAGVGGRVVHNKDRCFSLYLQ